MRLTEVQQVTGGTLHGADVNFVSVSIDTRSLQPADLFVAIKGENFNGNDFLAEAERRQAVAAIVSEKHASNLPLLEVRDGRLALGQLAALNRRQSKAVVLALTGSQGKTTVKEMLAAILSECGEVLATRANLNNDIGVPLTLLSIGPQHDYAVIEMGANAAGEIRYCSNLVRPDIAHITNVAATHTEGFGSLAGVATAKAEIWESLGEGSKAIINLDDNFAADWLKVNEAGKAEIVTVSAAGNSKALYRVSDVNLDSGRAAFFCLHTPQGSIEISLQLAGRHNIANAAAAAAMALEAGASLKAVREGLARVQAVPGRLCFRAALNGALLIDDSYNASPSSFRAAIDVLAARPGFKILALGDMAELGSLTQESHEFVGRYAREQGIDRLFSIGTHSRLCSECFGEGAEHFADLDGMTARITPLLQAEVSIAVKGSRSAGMDKLVQRLITKEA